MSIVRKFLCDVCGTTTESANRQPIGWTARVWVPGVLQNTKRKPDRHYCSAACVEEAKKQEPHAQ